MPYQVVHMSMELLVRPGGFTMVRVPVSDHISQIVSARNRGQG
jgi:hypothetical protein